MTTPKQFFDDHVVPPFKAWQADPLTEWIAKAAVQNLYIMSERFWDYWHSRNPGVVSAAPSARQFREYLSNHVCTDFRVVWDVADNYRHVHISRVGRLISSAAQTGKGSIGWDEGRWDEVAWDRPEELVVELDDGTKRPLDAPMESVFAMWERLIAAHPQ
jgi:hypothetical protein